MISPSAAASTQPLRSHMKGEAPAFKDPCDTFLKSTQSQESTPAVDKSYVSYGIVYNVVVVKYHWVYVKI